MNDKEIVKYAREMMALNLSHREFVADALMVQTDDEILLKHIKGVIALLKKAEEILESDSNEL